MGDEKSRPPPKRIEVVLRDLEALLRREFGNSLIVDDFTTSSLVAEGENYGSTMLRVDAEVRRDGKNSQPDKLSFVAKMVPPTEFQKILFDSPSTFRKEIYMFTDIAPAFQALERECGIPEDEVIDLLPKLYGSRLSIDEPEDKFDHDAVILMENLKLKNYACGDRKIGVDAEHARSVIEALARFHALGIAVKLKKPQLFEEFKIRAGIVGEAELSITEFVLRNVKEVPSLLPHLARIEKALLFRPSNDSELWSSIAHTDLWVNNIMFRDNASGIPESVKFVDFQNYHYQNPLQDLIFFLFTSCRTDVRIANVENLIDSYYEKFVSHLARLKCNAHLFTRDSFNEQLASAAKLEYLHCMFMIRIIILDSETDPASIVEPELLFEVEATEEYRERVAEISITFIKKNWI